MFFTSDIIKLRSYIIRKYIVYHGQTTQNQLNNRTQHKLEVVGQPRPWRLSLWRFGMASSIGSRISDLMRSINLRCISVFICCFTSLASNTIMESTFSSKGRLLSNVELMSRSERWRRALRESRVLFWSLLLLSGWLKESGKVWLSLWTLDGRVVVSDSLRGRSGKGDQIWACVYPEYWGRAKMILFY